MASFKQYYFQVLKEGYATSVSLRKQGDQFIYSDPGWGGESKGVPEKRGSIWYIDSYEVENPEEVGLTTSPTTPTQQEPQQPSELDKTKVDIEREKLKQARYQTKTSRYASQDAANRSKDRRINRKRYKKYGRTKRGSILNNFKKAYDKFAAGMPATAKF